MKTQKKNSQIKGILFVIFVVMMIVPFTSCAKKVTFLNSTVVPAAKGLVNVKKDNNQNYSSKSKSVGFGRSGKGSID